MNDINFDAYDRFQVLGQNLRNFKEGFGQFSLLASAIMLEEDLGIADQNGLVQFELGKWYPLKNNLRAFYRIGREYGGTVLRQMAEATIKVAQFPPTVVDINSGLASIDVAFHLNHGVNNEPMFSLATGDMQEGIGHYAARPVPGKKQITCVCDNPYPCDFDQGLILAMARRFQPTATLVHDNPAVCRSKGATNCTYSVIWK
jgi:hypothetical protein